MENELQIFNNPEFGTIRALKINGVPYFSGKDSATALKYHNTDKAIRDHVEAKDKIILKPSDLEGLRTDATFTIDSPRGMIFINESGLYSLIFSSKLPKAKEFARWVTSEVLPAIRKQGYYFLDKGAKNIEVYKKIAADPEFLIQMATAIKAANEENARLTAENQQLHQQVFEMTPKANYYDLILACPSAIPVTVIAKDYGMSGRKFNKLLNKLGVQFKLGGTWVLYSYYENRGWTVTKTHTFNHSDGTADCQVLTYWTQQGRAGLYELLKLNGYLPQIEKKQTRELALFA